MPSFRLNFVDSYSCKIVAISSLIFFARLIGILVVIFWIYHAEKLIDQLKILANQPHISPFLFPRLRLLRNRYQIGSHHPHI